MLQGEPFLIINRNIIQNRGNYLNLLNYSNIFIFIINKTLNNMQVVMEHDDVLFRIVAHRAVWAGAPFFGASQFYRVFEPWMMITLMRKLC